MSSEKIYHEVNIDIIIQRMKSSLGISKDKELALVLEISPQDFINRRKKGTLFQLLVQVALYNRMNMQWIFYGEEPEKKNSLEQIAHSAPWKIDRLNHDPDDAEIDAQSLIELLKKTADVLQSKTVFRSALRSNINAFHYSIQMDEQLDQVEKRMDNFEQQTQRKFIELAQQMNSLQEENDLLKKLLPQGGLLKIGETVPNGPPVEEKHYKDQKNIWKEGVTISNQPPGRKTK